MDLKAKIHQHYACYRREGKNTFTISLNKIKYETFSQNTYEFKYMSYKQFLFFFSFLKPSVGNNESALVKPVKK